MLTTAVIAFREFFEAFLIVGVFLGVSRKLALRRELEIALAALLGILISLVGASAVYFFGDHARSILTERNADALESYLLIFSGVFIAYVVFSLHGMMNKSRSDKINSVKKHLAEEAFDVSLFLTIVFLITREGFEIALFTASVSLFSEFIQNFLGLLIGFGAAAILGASTFFAYVKLPVAKVFKATEYAVVILGAALMQNGITKLFETHFSIRLSDMGSLGFGFLPGEDTFVGHVLQGLVGIDSEMSAARVGIMLAYIAVVYALFMRKPALEAPRPAS